MSRLFPALRYWLAMHVTYIIPPLEEDTAHLLDRPTKGKSEPVKPKDSMVVRYGKVRGDISLFGKAHTATDHRV